MVVNLITNGFRNNKFKDEIEEIIEMYGKQIVDELKELNQNLKNMKHHQIVSNELVLSQLTDEQLNKFKCDIDEVQKRRYKAGLRVDKNPELEFYLDKENLKKDTF